MATTSLDVQCEADRLSHSGSHAAAHARTAASLRLKDADAKLGQITGLAHDAAGGRVDGGHFHVVSRRGRT